MEEYEVSLNGTVNFICVSWPKCLLKFKREECSVKEAPIIYVKPLLKITTKRSFLSQGRTEQL